MLTAIGRYKEGENTIADALNNLIKELGDYKVDVKHARDIMDRYVEKTEKLSEEIESMREE